VHQYSHLPQLYSFLHPNLIQIETSHLHIQWPTDLQSLVATPLLIPSIPLLHHHNLNLIKLSFYYYSTNINSHFSETQHPLIHPQMGNLLNHHHCHHFPPQIKPSFITSSYLLLVLILSNCVCLKMVFYFNFNCLNSNNHSLLSYLNLV
jgi:hypothetical protein